MRKNLTIFYCLLFISIAGYSQVNNIHTILPETYNLDSLKNIYGKHKTFIPEFELQSLIALSHYPELKDCRISFRYKKIDVTGKAFATAFSFFKNNQRHYIVYIDDHPNAYKPLLKDIPFNAQVGILGHELGHLLDFKNHTRAGLIVWALNYMGSKSKRAFLEKSTDIIAIEHGLGWQLYDWINYALSSNAFPEKYKAFKRKYYLHPDEVLALIKFLDN